MRTFFFMTIIKKMRERKMINFFFALETTINKNIFGSQMTFHLRLRTNM